MKLTGAEIIIETLKNRGVDVIFGYPGGTAINVYDALFQRGEGLNHILTSHEQGAAHAADGYARATGKTGVCLVTSGPGATNLVTGIATAYMDSVPMVAITVNVPISSLGKDSFQEVDIAGITMPITKHNFIIRDIDKLEQTLNRAFDIAASGRPGPVLVDITKDVTTSECEYFANCYGDGVASDADSGKNGIVSAMQHKTCTDTDKAKNAARVKASAELLLQAERPALLVGGGAAIADAGAEIKALCDIMEMPVVDTLMGKGVYPGTEKNYLGMAGMYGTAAANTCMTEADVIIAVGTRFSERLTLYSPEFAAKASIIHIDIDRAELNKNIRAAQAISGDAKEVLAMLVEELVEKGADSEPDEGSIKKGSRKRLSAAAKEHKQAQSRKAWLERATGLKCEAGFDDIGGDAFTGPQIIRTICELTKGDAIITTEVGLNQMWSASYYTYNRPRQFITSGGLGTMGFGLGAAIGASMGLKGARIINIAGDGCFRMNMHELLTAVRLKLPIIEIIIDNTSLGMVRRMQDKLFESRYSQTEFDDSVDFVKIASAMGADAFEAASTAELKTAFEAAMKCSSTSVIVCRIER